MKIVFIGAGNLATCLSLEMQRAGMRVVQIYNRTGEKAAGLAKKLNCPFTDRLDEVIPDGDLYIFSVRDSALREVIGSMRPNDGLWVHAAGSVPMSIFDGYAKRYGVFYPFQTFTGSSMSSKLEKTPIFLETNNADDMKMLRKVAIALSGDARELDSEKRKYIHLAGVFACNFSNHMYAMAAKILEEQGFSYEALLPLITETARKLYDMPPAEAQTGPAVRFDRDIMDKHVAMLGEPKMQAIYRLISQSIYSEKLKE